MNENFRQLESLLIIPLAFLAGYLLRNLPLEEVGVIAIKLPFLVACVLGVVKFTFVDKHFHVNPKTSIREPKVDASRLAIGLDLMIELAGSICVALLLAALVLFGSQK